MSNEELVGLIQSGERDRLMELWQQVRRMALKEAGRWAAYRSNGVELEDLAQAGFIALMRAADSFDPTAGCRFSTWYYPVMKDEFQRAAGRRTEKQRRDPLHSAASLDIPVGEDEDSTTLGELVPDPAAEAAMLGVERREDLRRLHAALEAAVAILPPDLQTAIRARYYCGEIVDANAHNRAMRMLRAPKCFKALRVFL